MIERRKIWRIHIITGIGVGVVLAAAIIGFISTEFQNTVGLCISYALVAVAFVLVNIGNYLTCKQLCCPFCRCGNKLFRGPLDRLPEKIRFSKTDSVECPACHKTIQITD